MTHKGSLLPSHQPDTQPEATRDALGVISGDSDVPQPLKVKRAPCAQGWANNHVGPQAGRTQ
jgi:hypothetical protein